MLQFIEEGSMKKKVGDKFEYEGDTVRVVRLLTSQEVQGEPAPEGCSPEDDVWYEVEPVGELTCIWSQSLE